jgi:hypothetical protein
MLAPGRLPGLFQDPRIIAAAVAKATTALTKGAERGKPEICLHANYLKHLETGISDRIENFSCTRSCQDRFASKIMLR